MNHPPPTRLAVYTDYAYTEHNGTVYAERAFAVFMGAVLAHADTGTVIGRLRPDGGEARYPLPAATRFVALPFYADGSRPLAVARALTASARRFWRGLDDVDTVWVLGPHGLAVPFALLALLRGRRVRLGVRQDLRRYARTRHPGRRLVHGLADALELAFRLLARVCPVVVVGRELAGSYRGARSVHTASVSLIGAGDIVAAAPAPPPAGAPRTVLSVGRLEAEKNPLLLIEVAAELVASNPATRLIVCGEGPLRARLEARIDALGLGDHVELRGYVPFSALRELYRTSDVFLHVSLTEGLPQVLFEAFAAGLPVVATDVGGVRAAAEGAAELIEPESVAAAVGAVTRMLAPGPERERQIGAGLAVARAHTLQRESAAVAAFLLDGARAR